MMERAAAGVQIEKHKYKLIEFLSSVGEDHMQACGCKLKDNYVEDIYSAVKLQLEYHFEHAEIRDKDIFPAIKAAANPTGK